MKYGTVVKVTGDRHDTTVYPTAVVIDSVPVEGGGIRYRAIFLPDDGGRIVEANLYTEEVGSVIDQLDADLTAWLVDRCRDQGP